jgi:hypothetical protein
VVYQEINLSVMDLTKVPPINLYPSFLTNKTTSCACANKQEPLLPAMALTTNSNSETQKLILSYFYQYLSQFHRKESSRIASLIYFPILLLITFDLSEF